MFDEELISNFSLTVEGKALNTQCESGNKIFVITTNKSDVRNGSDILRGEETYDDIDFSG
jgi:hypothetical protein